MKHEDVYFKKSVWRQLDRNTPQVQIDTKVFILFPYSRSCLTPISRDSTVNI